MIEVTIPQLGLTMEEAEFVAWHVEVGELVSEGQRIAEIATDKIDHDLPSPVAGRIVELLAEAGQVLAVGAPIARVEPVGP
ncbi:MAG: biotin/lipoyl-containing protein [Acidimicrobiia bacterium]|nr:biotin/lipoyl-containing protein [Acidimicrobiia bacterium]